MLTILLKILSILGIVLLAVLGCILAGILLILFFPVTYRLEADRRPAQAGDGSGADGGTFLVRAKVKANWLFGLVRIRFLYPDPGELTAKVLWFSLIKPSGGGDEAKEKADGKNPAEKKEKEERKKKKEKEEKAEKPEKAEKTAEPEQDSARGTAEADGGGAPAETVSGDMPDEEAPEKQKESFFEKIKCTIQEICGKIKQIRENFEFYRELLLHEDTRGLLNHGFSRLGRILKSIRPRKLKADVRFGTGSPDTTGYVLGVYGMMSPFLGRHVNIKPDFEQAVFEGEVFAAGHITVFHLLRHGLLFLLDKRLRQLMRKLKSKDAPEEQKADAGKRPDNREKPGKGKARKARKWSKNGK